MNFSYMHCCGFVAHWKSHSDQQYSLQVRLLSWFFSFFLEGGGYTEPKEATYSTVQFVACKPRKEFLWSQQAIW